MMAFAQKVAVNEANDDDGGGDEKKMNDTIVLNDDQWLAMFALWLSFDTLVAA